MASAHIQDDFAFLILGELQDIRSEIKQLSVGVAIGGNKEWLKAGEFSRLCKLTTRTLGVYVNEGRFSDRAVRRVKRGSSFTNEFHRVIALRELQNAKTVLRR